MKTVCVVGGGLAGLASAHYALRLSPSSRVIVLEATNRFGGWVDTTRHQDGIIWEHGPRTVRPVGVQGANTLALVEELHLEKFVRPVLRGSPSASTRLVLRDGVLHPLPSTLRSLFKTLPPFTRPLAMALFRDLATSKLPSTDVPLYDFVSRRLGPEIADWAVDPLVRGVCAGDAKQVSVHFLASYLHSLEQRDGRIFVGVARDNLWEAIAPTVPTPEQSCDLAIRARDENWAVWGLAGGMTTLTQTLATSLENRGVDLRLESRVEAVEKNRGQITVKTEQEVITCDTLVMATPSFVAAPLLPTISKSLPDILAATPFVNVAVVTLEYHGVNVVPTPGFGFLVPSNQPEPILGCIYDTCTFSQGPNTTILTIMMGGAWYDEVIGDKGEEDVIALALDTVSRILNCTAVPVRSGCRLLPACIAQYTVGHKARVKQARALVKESGVDIRLVGSSYDGVGINDTILSSRREIYM